MKPEWEKVYAVFFTETEEQFARLEAGALVLHSGLSTLPSQGVDALRETVIKPLGRLCRDLPGLAGSTVLGDGRVALILDVPALPRQALKAAPAATA